MRKRIGFLLVVVMMSTFLGGCNSGGSGDTSSGSSTDNVGSITIGYSCVNLNDTYQSYMAEVAKDYASENDFNITVVDAQNDVVNQQDQVNTLISQGVNALVVVPADSSAMESVTAAAQEANIPLVYLNTNPYPDENFPENVYYVGSVEREAGEMQAEYVGAQLGEEGGGICVLQGMLTHEGTIKRSEGVTDTFKEKYKNIEVLAEETGEWQKDLGMSVTENWITSYGSDLKAICANNDEMALGAANALKEAGMTDVLVLGIDGLSSGLEGVEDGSLAGTVRQDGDGQASNAMKMAASLANGETPDEQVIWVPFELVTADNVSEFK